MLTDPAQIPQFANQEDQAQFWETHEFGAELLSRLAPLDPTVFPVRGRSKPIAIRFDEDILARLKAVAARKGKGYQSLVKEFVAERLYDEEKREGILSSAPSTPAGR